MGKGKGRVRGLQEHLRRPEAFHSGGRVSSGYWWVSGGVFCLSLIFLLRRGIISTKTPVDLFLFFDRFGLVFPNFD